MKNTNKSLRRNKWISMVLLLAMILGLFTGCGRGSETIADTSSGDGMPLTAESTDPKAEEAGTVDACQANGHRWEDQTCESPKTCNLCGETEGAALGHTWMDANYQAPRTCSLCEATEGEPLRAYFTESGLEEKLLAPAGAYSYTLVCGDETKTTVANVIVEDYRTIPSDETHAAMDGYEWKILSLKLHFADENAVLYSFYPGGYLWTDKYEAEIDDENGNEEADGVIEELFTTGMAQSFTWYGVEYNDGWLRIEETLTEWMQDEAGKYYIDLLVTVSVRVPVGYDGFVFGLEDHTWDWPAGQYLHEVVTDNTLLFRMD